MFNAHQKYICYPSVVCVGKETEVAIFPKDINRFFRENQTCKLAVLDLGADQDSYQKPVVMDHPCQIRNGCLFFTHYFDAEQEYSVRFQVDDGSVVKLSMYAVNEDLYQLRPLKGDLHSHSFFSDGVDGPAMTPADYREEGFDFFSLTDHNRMYPSEMAAQLYQGIPLGIHMIPGEEVHTPGSLLHIVHVGGTDSVCLQYRNDPEGYEAAAAELEKELQDIPELYRSRIAKAKWACDRIHAAGGIAIFAHPCWCPQRYNVTREFADLLFRQRIFDAFELMGGISNQNNNMQLALWLEHLLEGNPLAVVGSSDSHNHDFETKKEYAHRFTIVFAKENTTEAILEAIRGGYSLSAELSPGNVGDVRFYSTQMRLVQFAHFLYKNYFNETWRLCVGEGSLMRRYAEGEDVGGILAQLADTVENFYKRFYGKTPFEGLSAARLDYLNACQKNHETDGPVTKGSSLSILPSGTNKRQ